MDENLKIRAIEILEEEQNQLDGVFDKQSEIEIPSTIEKTSVTQNSDGTWNKVAFEEKNNFYDESVVGQLEEQFEKDANTLQRFCAMYDDKIIEFDNQINDLKDQITSLSIQANSGNCWPGIACSATVPGGSTCATGPLAASFSYASYTTIREDRDALSIYENMAGPNENFAADNPFDPNSIVTLTSPYSGYGYNNEKQDDGGTTLTTQGRFDISNTLSDHNPRVIGLQQYYTGSTIPASTCVSISNSIASLQSQIASLRAQREALVNRTNLNSVKSVKSEKELQNWGNKNLHKQIEARKTKNTTAISAINNLF
jgi:hypothetical protein